MKFEAELKSDTETVSSLNEISNHVFDKPGTSIKKSLDKHPLSKNIFHALDVLIEVFQIWSWVTNLTQKLFLSKMNVQIMRLINTLKVGRNGTSCLVPVVREFSNVRIPDYQFFSLVFLPLFQDGALLSSHGICCCLNDTILNNPTYLLIH